MKLTELATLIRSKNAGPFVLTFDIMFPNMENYRLVKASGALSVAAFARLYRVSENEVQFFESEHALGMKFSIPRPIFQADIGDGDMHGGQQFVPLMSLEIPEPLSRSVPD
jgi:hypothetical protein